MAFDAEAMNAALKAARVAQRGWAELSLAERLQPIARLRARLADDPYGLANVVAEEIGKAPWEAVASEIVPTADCCAFLMDRAPRVLAPRRESLKGVMPFTGHAVVHHLPWGVVAVLVPWNYPLFLCATSVLPALAAGNAVVIKASPRARKTIEAFGRWLWEAGIPREVAVVLDSSDEAGRALSSSPLVDRIVFTGGSTTGRAVLQAAAKNLVPATVELSGYDAVFVLDDADVELASSAVTFGMKLNAGRTCVCPRRVILESGANAFVPLFRKKLEGATLNAPMDAQTLKEADALAEKLDATPNCTALIERKRGDANKMLAYSGGAEALDAAQGNFVPAIVVHEVPDTAAALAADARTPYALGASIFTRDAGRAAKLAQRLRPGFVSINECLAAAGEATITFGGSGESGYGVRGGVEGLLEMTRPQTLAVATVGFRPHHSAGAETAPLLTAMLRARHAGSVFGRMKGWLDVMLNGMSVLKKK